MKFKSIILLATAAAIGASGCGRSEDRALEKKWSVPANWYTLREDQKPMDLSGMFPTTTAVPSVDSEVAAEKAPQTEENLASNVDTLFSTQGEAVSQTQEASVKNEEANFVSKPKPADWVPWHVAYFLTDLSVSVQGVLGGLIGKGTPTVTAIWRKQYPANASTKPVNLVPEDARPAADLPVIDVTAPPAELEKQVDPAVEALAASRKIKDKSALKKHVTETTRYFLAMMDGLEKNPGSPWWVSRFRMDFTVDASGVIAPAYTVGAEVKLRLEWHRMMKKQAQPGLVLPAPYADIKGGLRDFVAGMAQDLEVMSQEELKTKKQEEKGFKAYGFRVGVGISAKGTVGIAKATASAIGQVYFNRDVAKPVVNPKPVAETATVALIEEAPTQEHLDFAKTNDVFAEVMTVDGSQGSTATMPAGEPAPKSAVYKVNRKAFQKGLKRALKMGRFFAKRASRAHVGGWKIYELRTSFDVSISGNVGLTTVSGLGTTEINFYNQNF